MNRLYGKLNKSCIKRIVSRDPLAKIHLHLIQEARALTLKLSSLSCSWTVSGMFVGGDWSWGPSLVAFFHFSNKTTSPPPLSTLVCFRSIWPHGGLTMRGEGESGGGGNRSSHWYPAVYSSCWNINFLHVKRPYSKSSPLHGRPKSWTLLLEFTKCPSKKETPQSGWYTCIV